MTFAFHWTTLAFTDRAKARNALNWLITALLVELTLMSAGCSGLNGSPRDGGPPSDRPGSTDGPPVGGAAGRSGGAAGRSSSDDTPGGGGRGGGGGIDLGTGGADPGGAGSTGAGSTGGQPGDGGGTAPPPTCDPPCAAPTPYCEELVCVACPSNAARRCQDNVPTACVSGHWQASSAACSGSTPACTNGTCASIRLAGALVTVAPAAGAAGSVRLARHGLEHLPATCALVGSARVCVKGTVGP